MTVYRIVFTPEARDQLDNLYDYISKAADPAIAARFLDGVVDHVATLTDYPRRGTPRDDLRAGLRTVVWRRRVTIAFMVDELVVVIVGVFYGGRDFRSLLND